MLNFIRNINKQMTLNILFERLVFDCAGIPNPVFISNKTKQHKNRALLMLAHKE